AAGPIEQAVKEQPDPTSVAERSVADLPDAQPGPPPESIAAGEGMPKPRPDSHINYPLEDDMAELQHQHHANDIDDHQLKIANEPAFTAALNAKGKVQENVASAPDKFREQESARQGESDALAEKMSMQQLNAIHQVRTKELVAVTGKQEKAASKDSAARKKVAEDIDGIFKATKKNVNSILTKLNTEVKKKFDTAATSARAQFESFVTTKVSAYKRKRYSGASGKFKWAGDKLLGVPTTITIYFVLGRKLYTDAMDVALTDIANFVATQLTAAKQAIADGKKDVDTYVKKLPANLEQVGQDASRDIQNQFDALTTSVDNCEEDLVDSLAQQYTEHLKQVDARIEQMQEENKGLVTKAGEALDQVVSTIDEIKSTLTKLLAAAISAISVIVKDPIGFLNKLISGIKMGFDNFKTNIVDNIMSGLIQWLTGSMGSVGIQVPKDVLSPSGIFDLSMQVLGLTKDYFRDKAVKLVGKPLVEGMESSIEVFKIVKSDGITGLWKHVKDQFTDIKQVVMDAIRDMIIKKVIEAGIKWIIGLMSPAGAFIKAAMMIVDIVRFFVERGAQIIELVKAFIDGIKAIASGNVKAVAKAVENALIRSIPVLIGFLAALASVSGLTDRVKKIVERLRARVDRVIESVVLKAKKAFKKLVKSGKAKVKGGIEYVRKKLKPWRTKPEKFKSKDKEDHEIFFRDSGEKKVLYVASKNASPVEKFLIDKLGDEKEKDKEAPIREALKYYRDQVKTALDKAIEARKAYKDHKKIKGDKDSERKDSNLKKSADTSRLKVDKALQPFAKKLAKMEFNQESDLAVATHVKFKKKGERAGKVRAMPLTYLPGNTTGARPAGTTPPGYNAVNTAQKNKWERGHLLSDHMHGPAETWNLVPVTRSVNGQMREVENKVKPLIAKQGNVLIYSARVYYNDSFTNELKNVPTKIVLSYGKMKRDPGIPPSDLRFIPDGNAISKTIEQNLDNIDLTGTANQGELMKKDLIAEIPGFIAERKSAGQPYSWRAFSRKKNAIKYWKKNKILTQAQFDAIKKEYAKHV
ncbi:MAG: DNA/RNA non-specific endonuclease, partial [Bacteroidota bacterium]